jgi:hypothetical protein
VEKSSLARSQQVLRHLHDLAWQVSHEQGVREHLLQQLVRTVDVQQKQENTMSKKVKVTRTIVYDYDEVVQSIKDVRGNPDADISEDDVLDLIDAWVYEDFQSPVTLNLLNMEFVDVATEFINKGEQQ